MKCKTFTNGSVLLVTIFTFLVFMAIMIASVRFINRQFRATVNNEGEATSFRLADDGVDYTVFLLGSGAATIPGLLQGEQPIEQTVIDPFDDSQSGTFSLTFQADSTHPTEAMRITSVGRTAQGGGQCYTIIADVVRVTGTTIYKTSTWSSRSAC